MSLAAEQKKTYIYIFRLGAIQALLKPQLSLFETKTGQMIDYEIMV